MWESTVGRDLRSGEGQSEGTAYGGTIISSVHRQTHRPNRQERGRSTGLLDAPKPSMAEGALRMVEWRMG